MTRKRHILQPLLLLLLVLPLLLAGCRSSKKATREPDTTTGATTSGGESAGGRSSGKDGASSESAGSSRAKDKKKKMVSHINENRQTASGIRGRLNISLKAGSSPLSASGSIKMKRDEIIQLSVTALGLMEIGRLELTPEYLCILDRYHKRYLKERWQDIPSLRSANVDFHTFQAIFWNELFLPGSSALPTDEDFRWSTSGKRLKFEPKEKNPKMEVTFYTDEDKDLIYQTSLVARQGKLRFDSNCSAWNKLDGKKFPASLRLAISGSKAYSVDLSFTRLQTDEGMGDIATPIAEGKYTKVSLDNILKGLHF